MKKTRQIRIFSFALIALFLATSTIARVVVMSEAAFTSSTSIHTQSEAPYSSDEQFPFEEKEKEFEDKSEADDRNNAFSSNFFFICEVNTETAGAGDAGALSFSDAQDSSSPHLPLFLSHHRLLI